MTTVTPILVATGYAVAEVAPAALSATFLTSVAGVATYVVMALLGITSAAPDVPLGIWLGSAGLVGAALGVRLQARLPERPLRRGLGILAVLLASAYVAAVLFR